MADRYEDLDGLNLGGPGTSIHPGYGKDLMGNRQNTSLDKSHYGYYVLQYGKISGYSVIRSKFHVEWGRNGTLLTPYEKGGKHAWDPYRKR